MSYHRSVAPREHQQQNLGEFPNLKRWFERVRERPTHDSRLPEARSLLAILMQMWGHTDVLYLPVDAPR